MDAEGLRRRYREERDKRLRVDGNDQYLEPTGRFASLLDDPWTEPSPREPIDDEVTFAIIGAGFAGLSVGARLRQAGVDDIRLIDAAGDVGGVWYWNRYPGAMCDTAAMVYLPLLEETGHRPTMKYVGAPEIFSHAQRIAQTFDLYRNALFSTRITALDWDDDTSRWTITTDRGDRIRAKYVSLGTGPLNRAKLPGIDGIESFEGHIFHSSRWDYAYTGGGPSGTPMERLDARRVGIIGTGATAVQCIPPLGRDSGELFVFQRTPSAIDVRNNRPLADAEFAPLTPGWQQEWLMNFANLQTGQFADKDLVQDGWTDIAQRIRDRVVVEMMKPDAVLGPELLQQAYEFADDEKMEAIRRRAEEIVADPSTAEALKPWYRQLCKRPCFHDEYLQTFNRPNVHLVDTDGKGVTRIDATGVWVGDDHFDLDCIVVASGFEVGTPYARRNGFEITGRDGLTLSQHWDEGMRTLHGLYAHGFPNAFIVGLGQGANLISNVTHNFTDSAVTVAAVVAEAERRDAREVEASADAEDAWVALIEGSDVRLWGSADCTPGYYNNEGGPIGPAQRRNAGYPGGPVAFFEMIERWRNAGDFDGLTFTAPVSAL